MCEREHLYTVVILGQPARNTRGDSRAARDLLLSIDTDNGEEGYVIANHDDDTYCPAESNRIENEAIRYAMI